jgi:hypothetical protein
MKPIKINKHHHKNILLIFEYTVDDNILNVLMNEISQHMANKLRIVKSDEEILHCTASLYSVDTFLYKLLNSSLRNTDMDKVSREFL